MRRQNVIEKNMRDDTFAQKNIVIVSCVEVGNNSL